MNGFYFLALKFNSLLKTKGFIHVNKLIVVLTVFFCFMKCTLPSGGKEGEKGVTDGDLKVYKKIMDSLYKDNEEVTDIDGNLYHTVLIGKQTWLVENLKVTCYNNGDSISYITEEIKWFQADSGAYCFYNNNRSNVAVYGALYNWYAAADARKICPHGYHIPSVQEWKVLINYLGGYKKAGSKMKSGLGWAMTRKNPANNNLFMALPGGTRSNEQNLFFDLSIEGYFRAIDEYSDDAAFFCLLYNGYEKASLVHNSKMNGLSVRCIKDNELNLLKQSSVSKSRKLN